MRSPRIILIIYLVFSLLLFIHQGYFLDRTEFKWLFFDFSLLFMAFAVFISRSSSWKEEMLRSSILIAGITLRLALLFYLPNLSDDYHRFLWDGNLMANGVNPYSSMPVDVQEVNSQMEDLRHDMNSPSYYTVYPPINQILFSLAVIIAPGNTVMQVLILKVILLIFDIICMLSLMSMVRKLGLPIYWAALYLLNPLVIIETVGNLHFEGITVALLSLSLLALLKSKETWSSVFFGLAAGIKFIPLILFPALWRRLGLFRGVIYGLIAGGAFVALFLPFIGEEFLGNIMKSIGLYFKSFEFNGSIYNAVRFIGFQVKGYNIIATSGWVLSVIAALIIFFISFRACLTTWSHFFIISTLCLITYYAFSTTVHPWYLINVLFFGALSGFHFTTAAWTFLVIFSYSTYSTENFSENSVLLIIEYLLVYLALFWELKLKFINGELKFIPLSRGKKMDR